METIYEGECCTDCLMLIANGDLGQNDEQANAAHQKAMNVHLDRVTGRSDWTAVPSGSEDDEPHFSSRQCDACGSTLAGDREKFACLAEVA